MTNRFFSVAGTTNGILDNTDILLHRRNAFQSFFRFLRPEPDCRWRWYSSDPAVLRAVDDEYLLDAHDDHFAYFDQFTEGQPRSFLSDLYGSDDQDPDLPNVAWIDPNFAVTAEGGHLTSNDDHPPAPVIRGQRLIHKLYEALRLSKYWTRSMLVITYDEHGGFFDHEPPPTPDHGPRVPALVVSPHAQPGCCSTEFDHASLIKSILLRFGVDDALEKMPERVTTAHDLGATLGPNDSVGGSDVTDPGKAAFEQGSDPLLPMYLAKPSSTVPRAVELLDRAPTDLQRDIALMAIHLRTGIRSLRLLARLPQTLAKALADLRRRVTPSNRKLAERRP